MFCSYAALGLLPSIPLPSGASSSRSHRAQISVPPSSAGEAGAEATAKVSYGRIVRDEAGNVVDIILEDEDQEEEKDEALNPEEEYQPEAVEAKTDVVRCTSVVYHGTTD